MSSRVNLFDISLYSWDNIDTGNRRGNQMGGKNSRNKGPRKSQLKRFSASVINAGQGVDKRYIDRFKGNARSSGRVRDGATIQIQDNGLPMLPSIIHPDEIPRTRSHRDSDTGRLVPGISAERSRVVEKLHLMWVGELRLHGWQDFNRVCVRPGKITKIWLYFSAQTWFFVEETPWIIKRSIIYSSRENAYREFGYGTISWVEVLDPEDKKR